VLYRFFFFSFFKNYFKKDVEMKDGKTWCVLSAKWWVLWKEYSGYREDSEEGGEVKRPPSRYEDDGERTPSPPGRINNSDIVGHE
jgi:hypothetical protein